MLWNGQGKGSEACMSVYSEEHSVARVEGSRRAVGVRADVVEPRRPL